MVPAWQGMEAEAAKAAAMRAKDTQLSTLTRLLSPPQLGGGERSDSDADDAEAHLQPYALQHGDDGLPAAGAAQPQPSSSAAAGAAERSWEGCREGGAGSIGQRQRMGQRRSPSRSSRMRRRCWPALCCRSLRCAVLIVLSLLLCSRIDNSADTCACYM